MPLTRRAFGLSALAFGLSATVSATAGRGATPEAPPVIAAASDLRFALEEIAAGFRAETGHGLRLTFGSTGNFARQIRAGAPYQLFMAADEDYVLALARDGFTRDRGVLYATGRVAIAVPRNGSGLSADGRLEDLRAALAEGRVRRFAIANPDHAPYGMRAREALQHAGLWAAIRPALILGENVSQAAQFAMSGSADGGIIAWSLALSPQLAAQGRFALIPADWHAPLRQRMALMPGAGAVARAFYDHLQQPAARAIMARYGFALPD
ncbi:molybdate ABC transporter substrate-binding protein [Jhaorihella thermophila]|uniref:Molybdate transport system substrate-binding protein n=1 Tax=Jhaorihella thermophila TaxID=488547 RepID=A0A1H5YUG5_9RHOB|nr:molybdate ABC transporter substrate-binding protein [Jhaorihella thermophila]SEG26916.1 molybdate transport system substrate-binding protein [Jhaorihella thermophila]